MRADYLRAESSPRERERNRAALHSRYITTRRYTVPRLSPMKKRKEKKGGKKSSIKMAGHKRE
jgi:hypothetical protein